MIKRILLITLLLIPLHTSAHDWDFTAWLQKSVDNDASLAVCYKLLIDKNYDTFVNLCDIHAGAMEYTDLMKEFNFQRERYHTDMTDADFLAEHFSGELLPRVQRNFRLQQKVRVAIMTLILAENMLYIDNY